MSPRQLIAGVVWGVSMLVNVFTDSKVAFWIMLAALGVLLTGCVQFDNTWRTENRRLETAYQIVHAVDFAQTLQIENRPELRESNWLLGDHPTKGKIFVGYMVTAYGHTLITDQLDKRNAPVWVCRTWQALTILDAANAVRGNYQLGLKWGF